VGLLPCGLSNVEAARERADDVTDRNNAESWRGVCRRGGVSVGLGCVVIASRQQGAVCQDSSNVPFLMPRLFVTYVPGSYRVRLLSISMLYTFA